MIDKVLFPVQNIGYNLNAIHVTKSEIDLTIHQRRKPLMTEIMVKT
jgi:hypothetical protein